MIDRFVRVAFPAALVAAAASASVTSAAEPKIRLFVLSGQSNMAGLNPRTTFEPAVRAAFPDDECIVVKHASGGQPIRRWDKQWKLPAGATDADEFTKLPPGDMYDALLVKVRAALGDRRPHSAAFVWMQGERDARMGWHEIYADSLRRVVGQLQQDLQHDDWAVVVGRLSDCNLGNANWDAVRVAQAQVVEAAKFAALVDTDDLNNKGDRNDLHYTPEGYAELGRRFAEQSVRLMRAAETSSK